MKSFAASALLVLALGFGCQGPRPIPFDDGDPEAPGRPEPALPDPEGVRAFADLDAYYRDPGKPPPSGAALRDLASPDPERRRSAGRYLHALLAQLFADESNGRGVWKQTGFWGGGSESPTREFRIKLARELAGSTPGEEALEAVRWLLGVEKLAENQVAGVELLGKIRGGRSDELLAEILREPHPNGQVLSRAIEETGRRGLRALAPEVTLLANHHRRAVRESARRVAPSLGLSSLPAFDPLLAFTPAFEARVWAFADLVYPRIPPDASWARFKVTTPSLRPGGEPSVDEFTGWRVELPGEGPAAVDAYGHPHRIPAERTEVTPATLREEVQRFLELRKAAEEGDREKSMRLSRGGGLSGQFEPKFISAPEALLAAWSLLRGDRATAAELLLPRFDAAPDDRWISWAVRDLLGHVAHTRMLDLFSYLRDYASAERLAAHLSRECFEGYEYQPRAKKLNRQLKRRTEDFKTFTLPAAEEWTALRASLDPASQVRYLADRLRLLNCFQMSQPGDVHYSDPQYLKPMAEFRWNEDPRKWPTHINPYNELRKLKISVAELGVLVPYLADEDFMPTYSFWRGFHPSRTLHQVNWAVARIVNEVAVRDLADLDEYERLDPPGRRAYLSKIAEWVREHSTTPRSELLLEALRTATSWEKLAGPATEAFAADVPGALESVIEKMPSFPDHQVDFAEICQVTQLPGALPLARSWVKDPSRELRFYGDLILLRGGADERQAALASLQSIFSGGGLELLPYAIDELLALRAPEGDRLALLALKPVLEIDREYGEILRRLFLRGLKPCRDYIVDQLSPGRVNQFQRPVSDDMASLLYNWKDDFKINDAGTSEGRARFLSSWIKEQFARIERGEKSEVRTETTPIRRRRWVIDAP